MSLLRSLWAFCWVICLQRCRSSGAFTRATLARIPRRFLRDSIRAKDILVRPTLPTSRNQPQHPSLIRCRCRPLNLRQKLHPKHWTRRCYGSRSAATRALNEESAGIGFLRIRRDYRSETMENLCSIESAASAFVHWLGAASDW